MPSTTIVHAACFAVGAIVGGGVAATVTNRRKVVPPPPPPAQSQTVTVPPPVIKPVVSMVKPPTPILEVESLTGKVTVSKDALAQLDNSVLRYGNPGELHGYSVYVASLTNVGPISDMLVRTAYVAGYDRRLRHPAWVRIRVLNTSVSDA